MRAFFLPALVVFQLLISCFAWATPATITSVEEGHAAPLRGEPDAQRTGVNEASLGAPGECLVNDVSRAWSAAGGAPSCEGRVIPGSYYNGDPVQAIDNSGEATGSALYRCIDGQITNFPEPGYTCRNPLACEAQAVYWAPGCSAFVQAMQHGDQRPVANDGEGFVGDAFVYCNNSHVQIRGQSCQEVAVADCESRGHGWGVGCSATSPPMNEGESVTIQSTSGVDGTLTVQCLSDGSHQRSSEDCNDAPPPNDCNAEVKSWNSGGHVCSAEVPPTDHNDVAGVNSTNVNVGSASFRCDDGQFVESGSGACAPPDPPPSLCAEQGVVWVSSAGQQCFGTAPETEDGEVVVVPENSASPGAGDGQQTFECDASSGGAGVFTPVGTEGGSPAMVCNPPSSQPCTNNVARSWHDSSDHLGQGPVCQGSTGAGTTPDGGTVGLSSANANTGSAQFACVNGVYSATPEPGATCISAPVGCDGGAFAWGGGCAASTGAIPSGGSAPLNNTVDGYSGSAEVQCANGVETVVNASCAREYASCSSVTTRSWTVSAQTCEATVSTVVLHGDTVSFQDSSLPTTGIADFRCDDGVFDLSPEPAPAPTCAIPGPVDGRCGVAEDSCDDGDYFDAADQPGGSNWECRGVNGGADAQCRRENGRCGPAQGVSTSTFPVEADLCEHGASNVQDGVAADFEYNWQCLGLNGGSNAFCSTPFNPGEMRLQFTASASGGGGRGATLNFNQDGTVSHQNHFAFSVDADYGALWYPSGADPSSYALEFTFDSAATGHTGQCFNSAGVGVGGAFSPPPWPAAASAHFPGAVPGGDVVNCRYSAVLTNPAQPGHGSVSFGVQVHGFLLD